MATYEINYTTTLACYAQVTAENFDEALDLFYKGEYDDYDVLEQDIDGESIVITEREGF